jgi:hypothetical protein
MIVDGKLEVAQDVHQQELVAEMIELTELLWLLVHLEIELCQFGVFEKIAAQVVKLADDLHGGCAAHRRGVLADFVGQVNQRNDHPDDRCRLTNILQGHEYRP